MYNNKMKIIILLSGIVLAICIILIIILSIIKNKEEDERITSEVGGNIFDFYAKSTNNGINREAYYDILTCVNRYLDTVNVNNSGYYSVDENGKEVRIVSNDDIKKKAYNLISKNYINQKGITQDNIDKYIKFLDTACTFIPLEASAVQDSDISSFLMHGLIQNLSTYKSAYEIFFVINIDAIKNLYSIEPIEGNYKSISEIKITNFEKTIEANKENKYKVESISYDTDAKNYINLYKRLALSAPEIIYNKLNNEYKQKRFGSLDNFKKYIEDNRQEIIGLRAEQYLVNSNDNYKEYVIKDQYDNIYIVNEFAILNYELTLDTYTLVQSKFIQEYSAANNQKKVMMNIDKFFQMINNKDYKAAYNCLSQSFKNNYFKTQDSFEKYAKSYFYKYNTVKYKTYNDKISGVYGYELIITNKQDTTKTKIFNIVMKLNRVTDFEISFEI